MEDEFNTATGSPKKSELRNLKKTALVAALLFLVPFTAATLLGLLVNRFSPVRQGARAAREAAAMQPPGCAADAGIDDLLSHRTELRNLGLPIEPTNLRIWAAAAAEPALLIHLDPPEAALSWEWHLSQDGLHALAVAKSPGVDSLLKEVALYSFAEGIWLWKNTLPWPEVHEAPWVFHSTTVVRSSKNNRRFAMEINPAGDIVALDALGAGAPAPAAAPAQDSRFKGQAIAAISGVFFVVDEMDSTLKGYALQNLPGLYDAGAFDRNSCFSGNGLLKFRACDGTVTVHDAFTQLILDEKSLWRAATNTVVTAIKANHDGSELSIQLETTFAQPDPVVRDWNLSWQPVNDIVAISMTNRQHGAAQSSQASIQSPDSEWRICLRENSVLEIAPVRATGEVVSVDLKNSIPCGSNPVTAIALLEGNRFILLTQRDHAFLLDWHAVAHYGDLRARLEHCKTILAGYAAEALHPAEPDGNLVPEISTLSEEDDADTFNYEMTGYSETADPRLLEPPSLPSVLSLQAELLANHRAWLYASCQLEQLMQIQERDSRAPRANPLLYTRYNLLTGNPQKVKEGSRSALDALFYDTTPFNQMIRWQMLKTLFPEKK